jgi:MerR family transcriptional regulator, repressor of the yfmOP operon
MTPMVADLVEKGVRNSPPRDDALLSIGAAAARAGVSIRALRYYQQRGLLAPGSTTGGLRRYSESDLARVARIRELQSLLGLDLDEIATVLHHEDRVAEIRAAYLDQRTSDPARRELLHEALTLHLELRATIESKRAALDTLLDDLDARVRRIEDALGPAHKSRSHSPQSNRPKSGKR